MPSQGTAVFVSYSHADASLVAPVVKLLRVNKALVFQDIDRIQPGKKWRSEINKALAEAQLVVVFWCDHANRSNEVWKEWKAAIEQEKDLLPLLLDATPLPPELSEFQWIDFRGTVGANHTSVEASALRPAAPVQSGRRLSLFGFASVVVVAVGVSLYTFIKTDPPGESGTVVPRATSPNPVEGVTMPRATLPSPVEPGLVDLILAGSPTPLLLVSTVLATTVCVVWFLRRRLKRGIVMERARSRQGEIERRIAAELEAEILRRTTSREDADA